MPASKRSLRTTMLAIEAIIWVARTILAFLPRVESWRGWLASPCANSACPAASDCRPWVPALPTTSLKSSPSALRKPLASAIGPSEYAPVAGPQARLASLACASERPPKRPAPKTAEPPCSALRRVISMAFLPLSPSLRPPDSGRPDPIQLRHDLVRVLAELGGVAALLQPFAADGERQGRRLHVPAVIDCEVQQAAQGARTKRKEKPCRGCRRPRRSPG